MLMAKRRKPAKGKRSLTAPMLKIIRRNDAKVIENFDRQNLYFERMRKRGISVTEATKLYYNKDWNPSSPHRSFRETPHFHYPTLNIGESFGTPENAAFKRNPDSLLSVAGYSNATNRTSFIKSRRDMLEYAFKIELTGRFARFFPEWGRPLSPTRLKKIAWTMASVIKDAKRRRVPRNVRFLELWISDFYYLKDKYYDDVNKRLFIWPNIEKY